MKKPYLLHIFNPTKNVSPFDVNMAYEAEFDGVIPYTEVVLEDIHNLTQDVIFSRSPSGVKRTGIFIGGKDFSLAVDMLNRSRSAMSAPFEVPVFADPSGAITTAAALIACIEVCLRRKDNSPLQGKRIDIFGGTGPVGVCAGIIAANCGAEVHLISRRGKKVAEDYAEDYNNRFNVTMQGKDGSTQQKIMEFLPQSQVIVGAVKAGIQVLSQTKLAQAEQLLVAADVNAVPPAGFEGIGIQDFGKELDFTPNNALGLGALAIGDIKYKVQFRILEEMKKSESPLYIDHNHAFALAREIIQDT